MAFHTLVIEEDDPNHIGFTRRYYANIEVMLNGSDWYWRQMHPNGNYIGASANGPHPSEGDAKQSALTTLNGDFWE